MIKSFQFIIVIFFSLALLACRAPDRYQDKFWVISDKTAIHERPTNTSKLLQELKLGGEVYCRDTNPSYAVPKGWVEAKTGDIRGFIERRTIAGKEMYDEIQKLITASKETPVQAAGIVRKKAYLRLRPEKESFVIGRLKEPAKADVIERLVTTVTDKAKSSKQLWYKVLLDDGRAGFVTKSELQLTPPDELNSYTSVRTPVSWYALGQKEDPATEIKGTEYLVTYASIGSDIGTDFTRIELYQYDPKTRQYGTALAKSNLYGILPVKISDEGDSRKLIEIREHPKGNENKLHIMQYTYPSPIKLVKDYTEDVQ